jgi:uncharacterized protein (DUF849 family)
MSLNDLEPKSDAYKVRQLLDEINAATQRGVGIADIHARLCEAHGLTLTLEAFRTTLKRARAKKKLE